VLPRGCSCVIVKSMDYLSQRKLQDYVTSIAAKESLWRHLVSHGEQRAFKKLVATDLLNAWVISWDEGHDTGLHDHDGSAGAVIVVAGEVWESRLRKEKPVLCTPIEEKGMVY